MQITFYQPQRIEDTLLKYAVIVARYQDKWVFVRHKQRQTWEIPGGHREPGETIDEAARRELYEETGAVEYEIGPLCVYSVTDETGEETFGMLYAAEVTLFEGELHSEIERIELFEELPDNWTYPLIQPLLVKEYLRRAGTAPIISL